MVQKILCRKREILLIFAGILLLIGAGYYLRVHVWPKEDRPVADVERDLRKPLSSEVSSEASAEGASAAKKVDDAPFIDDGVALDTRFSSELPLQEDMEGILHNLRERAKVSPVAKYIVDHRSAYTKPLLQLAANRVDSLGFVYHARERKGQYKGGSAESYPLHRAFPLYIQWDPRWGYTEYPEDLFCSIGCGPTTLSMLLNGYGETIDPAQMMQELREKKRYHINQGTSWEGLCDTLRDRGFTVSELPSVKGKFMEQLQNGEPIVVNVGKSLFTTGGHYLLLVGLDGHGKILLNDSHSIRNSQKAWEYEEIAPYIRAAWAVSLPGKKPGTSRRNGI